MAGELSDAFWKREQSMLVRILTPVIEESASTGAKNATGDLKQVAGVAVDFKLVNKKVSEWSKQYTFDLVKGITDTSRDSLQTHISSWVESGAPLDDLISDIKDSGMFDASRAERIGTTEATRAFQAGNVQTWKEADVKQFEFRTAEDELVCDICGPNAGQVFDIDDEENSPPLHTNCRCWTVPVVDTEAAKPEEGDTETPPEAPPQEPAPEAPPEATSNASREVVDWADNKWGDQVADNGKRVSENFTNWFEDSRVVDESGKPLTVYHGTNADFEAFDVARIGERDSGNLGHGFYFSSDPEIGRTNTNIKPVYIKSTNPLELKYTKFGEDKEKIVRDALGLERNTTAKDVTSALKERGHDGVILDYSPTGYKNKEVMVFDPSQIKSATGNAGTFNPADPRITKSVSKEISYGRNRNRNRSRHAQDS